MIGPYDSFIPNFVDFNSTEDIEDNVRDGFFIFIIVLLMVLFIIILAYWIEFCTKQTNNHQLDLSAVKYINSKADLYYLPPYSDVTSHTDLPKYEDL
ncbi:hypothetical protein HZS_7430 [Henneguya salminicola]|nr:hypothetical protein HZS_7430 [Henneguya salminicola]